jgi:hypothetical protein
MRAALILLALTLVGCGYMGDTLPPALKRPVPVTDLSAVERGSRIIIQFTVPKVTTEDLPVVNPDLELRIGPVDAGLSPDAWAKTADRVTAISDDKGSAKAEVPAAKYDGRKLMVAVNVHGPGERSAGWSNLVSLTVVPPLETPRELNAKDGPDSIVLNWQGTAPEFRIFRKAVSAPDWTRIGIAKGTEYSDPIEYGQTYQYYVQAQAQAGDGYAESDESDVKTFQPADKFPPAVPAGLSVVPGPRSMELVWDRNTEKDFAAYRIYRDGQALPQTVSSAAYSDRDVQPGSRHSYEVSAIDTAGNESLKSPAVAGELP